MTRITRLENDTTAGELTLHWQDGSLARIAHPRLRAACRCAYCRAATLRGNPPVPDASVRLLRIGNMGYGVQLTFSDGHDHGIYPYPYLAELASAG
mgnify:CR=1 FL=1